MNVKHTVKTAYKGIILHKGRTLLTLLGIIIGITSIMMILSIGNGAEGLILNEIGGLGAETIVLRPGKEPEGPTDIAGTIFADSIKEKDVEALKKKNNVPHLADVSPGVIVAESASFEGETYRPQILGWSAEFMSKMLHVYPEKGVLFGDYETEQNQSVAVIGAKVKDELFGNKEALGQNITIKNKKFRVVGILPKKGQAAFVNVDELVLIPYTTAQKYLLGIDYYNEVIIKADSPDNVARTVEDIKQTIRESHNITDPKKDDFFVVTQEGLVSQIKTIVSALTAFLSSVVAIALVVGGIGVMNIMLVSVTERTKEIGLRKALGATNKDILQQFMFEAMMLTGIGGIVGVLLGALLSLFAAIILREVLLLDWVFTFPFSAAILGFGASAFVGLVFGIYPARQASKKSPMEALRYE